MLFSFLLAFVEFVNPFVGTSGTSHTTPAATCPFGMLQPGPDTGKGKWAYCSGYQFGDTNVLGFSQTHISGSGGCMLGDFRILPYVGEGEVPEKTVLDKSGEHAEAGFYAVTAGGVRVEITASPRVAFYRLTFPEGAEAHVKLDPVGGLAPSSSPRTVVTHPAPDLAAGDCRIGYGCRNVFWRMKSSVPFEIGPVVTIDGMFWRMDFPKGTRTVELRIALSAKSGDGAARNLATGDGVSFDAAKSAAAADWEKMLARLPIEADDATKRVFYTALYHVCFQPNLYSDAGEPERYANFSYWDTFRAAHPLYTLLVPEKIPAFVESELDQYARTGRLSSWSLSGVDAQAMIGIHAIPPLVDACLKGLVDAETERRVYAAVRASLRETHAKAYREDWDFIDTLGYYPHDAVEEAASRTLEDSYDADCARRLAEKLGEKDDAAFFAKRAGAWRNVFDAKTGFARPRLLNGNWWEPFDPTDNGRTYGFTEANAWQYTWHVLHDVPGLIAALGGKEKFATKLAWLFEQPYRRGRHWTLDISGEIGQYAHGNEPSHHIPFLFYLADRPDLGDKCVKRICETLYGDGPNGLCGNDDCGQLSAWYVFAMLGLYPVDPCGGDYVIGTPQVGFAPWKGVLDGRTTVTYRELTGCLSFAPNGLKSTP